MLYTGNMTTFAAAGQLSRQELAERWGRQPEPMPRDRPEYLLECAGLSTELELLAVTTAVTASLAEMIHRAVFVGADLDQVSRATNIARADLRDAWHPWASQLRDTGVMPAQEYDFINDRLAGQTSYRSVDRGSSAVRSRWEQPSSPAATRRRAHRGRDRTRQPTPALAPLLSAAPG